MTHLKITSEPPRKQYTATADQTDFVIPFRFFADADIKVYLGTSTTPESSGYTITGANTNANGTLSFGAGRAAGTLVTIARESTIERVVDFTTSGDWTADNVNDQLDRLTTYVQEVKVKSADLAVTLPITTQLTSLTFPDAGTAANANKVIAWNAAGNALVNGPTSADITNAATYAANALTAKNEAEAAASDLNDRFLGNKTADPTLDNDGDPLQIGALYYNTTSKAWKYWDGFWYNMTTPATPDAADVPYDNTTSGNPGETVQEALDNVSVESQRKLQSFSPSGTTDEQITIAAGPYTTLSGVTMKLASALNKTITGTWVEGAGAGLDTGTVQANTVYYVWLIKNPTSGTVDALFSTSLSTPTMPGSYTLKRLLGYVKTDASSDIKEWYVIWSEFGTTSVLKAMYLATLNSSNTMTKLKFVIGADPAAGSKISIGSDAHIRSDGDIEAYATDT